MSQEPAATAAESAPASSDERLVRRCLGGDESAWSELVDKYKNLIYSIPVKFGIPHQESGDIFQSVCLELLRELPRVREPRALPAWLIRVTSNKCYRYKQNAQRKTSREAATGDLETLETEVPSPDELVAQTETEQALRDAARELSERCRALIRMLFFETPPRPYAAVAESLGLARGSIGFIRGRCLDRLRRGLERRRFR